MGWGRVSPAPWPLVRPVGYQSFVQACVGLALVAPYPIVVFHTTLLSARCSEHRADFCLEVSLLTLFIIAQRYLYASGEVHKDIVILLFILHIDI